MQLEPDELLRWFFYHVISLWQCGPVVWEPPIPLASVLSYPLVCAKSGKETVRHSRWRHSSCTVESRIERAENAMGLGLSPILGVLEAVTLVRKIFKNGQERGEPLGCYSYGTSSTTSTNTCLCFGHKNIQSDVIRRLAGAGELSSRRVFSEN